MSVGDFVGDVEDEALVVVELLGCGLALEQFDRISKMLQAVLEVPARATTARALVRSALLQRSGLCKPIGEAVGAMCPNTGPATQEGLRLRALFLIAHSGGGRE